MLDESKHRFWKLKDGVKLKQITCNVCGHRESIEDKANYGNRCAFCGHTIALPSIYFEEVEKEEPKIGGEVIEEVM